MRRLLCLAFLSTTIFGQGASLADIRAMIAADPTASRLAKLSPNARKLADVKTMISEGELDLASLVQRRVGLLVFPKDEQQYRKDVFKELFPKLIAPTTGAMTGSSGSTSAVSGTGVPMILNVAFERGGITQSTKGTVLTMKGNLLGIARGLGASDAYCLALSCGAKEDILRRVTFGVGFDMSRTTSEAGTGTVAVTNQPSAFRLQSAKEQFDHFTMRFDIRNRRDIRGSHFKEDWEKLLKSDDMKAAAVELSKSTDGLLDLDVMVKARQKLEPALLTAAGEEEMAVAIDTIVNEAAKAIMAKEMSAQRLDALQKAHTLYAGKVDTAARDAATAFSHAIEYTLTRPKNQPEITNLRYVASGGFGTNEVWRGTVNAGLDFYTQKPVGTQVGTLRDAQLSAQLDRIFWAKKAVNLTFSAAGYFQWMKERAVIVITPGDLAPGTNISLSGAAPALLAPEGSIGLAQLKLTLGVRDTKVKLPLSFTVANRSELIKPNKRVLGGQFGISYDFDSLFKP